MKLIHASQHLYFTSIHRPQAEIFFALHLGGRCRARNLMFLRQLMATGLSTCPSNTSRRWAASSVARSTSYAEVSRHLLPTLSLSDRNDFSCTDYRLNMSSIPFEALHEFRLPETLMSFCSCRERSVPVSKGGTPLDIVQPRHKAESTGITRSVRIVELTIPPIIGTAIRFMTSAPVPVVQLGGVPSSVEYIRGLGRL